MYARNPLRRLLVRIIDRLPDMTTKPPESIPAASMPSTRFWPAISPSCSSLEVTVITSSRTEGSGGPSKTTTGTSICAAFFSDATMADVSSSSVAMRSGRLERAWLNSWTCSAESRVSCWSTVPPAFSTAAVNTLLKWPAQGLVFDPAIRTMRLPEMPLSSDFSEALSSPESPHPATSESRLAAASNAVVFRTDALVMCFPSHEAGTPKRPRGWTGAVGRSSQPSFAPGAPAFNVALVTAMGRAPASVRHWWCICTIYGANVSSAT